MRRYPPSTMDLREWQMFYVELLDFALNPIEQVAEGAIGLAQFAANIRPFQIVAALPSLPNATYPPGEAIVFCTADGKLWRNVSDVWTAAVPTSDLTGQITETQITDSAVTSPKIAAGTIVASNIAGQTITGDLIAAGTILGGNIAAGTITGSKISSGTISTSNLIVGSPDNLIPNGTSEMGSSVSGLDPEGINLVNEPANAYAGNWCRKFVANATDYFFFTTTGYGDNRMKAQAGEEYYLSAYIKCTSGGATLHLSIWYYDGNFSNIGGNSNVLESTGSYAQYSTWVAAPAGTQYVLFGLYAEDSGTYYVDNIFAKRMTGGNLIVDGAIVADKIAAGAITATHVGTNEIIANAANIKAALITNAHINDLSASKINTGTLSAGYIQGGTLNCSLITVSNLSASSISTGTLSASYISGGTLNASLMTVSNLSASSISTGTLSAGYISGGTLNCSLITVSNLSASSISTGTLSAGYISGGTLNCSLITVSNLSASSINTGTLNCSLLTVSNLSASSINTGTLNCSNFTVSNLSASSINTGTLNCSLVTVSNLSASSINTGSMSGTYITATSIAASKLNISTLSSITANIGTITAGKCQNTGGTNFIDFNATGTSSFLKVGSNVDIKADGTGTFKRIIVTNPWVESYGTKTGVGFQEAEKTIYIDTTINELTDPWYTTENTTRIARVSPGTGTRSGSHNLVLWKLEPSYFEARGYEVSGPSYVTWQGINWYWGDVGIKVVGICMNYIVGDNITNLAWSSMRV